MMAEKLLINSLVPPTWNRLKVNDTTVELPLGCAPAIGAGEVNGQETDASLWQIETGCGRELTEFLEKNGTKPVFVKTEGSKLLSVKKKYIKNSADILCLEAKDGETINVLTDMTSEDETECTAILKVLIKAGKNSVVNLAQLVRPGKGMKVVTDIGSVAEESATINMIQVFMDGNDIYTGSRTALVGENSVAENRVGLVRTNGQTLDMNYVMKHIAKCTVANIDVTGALSKKAQKIFRGTIDFISGCTGSDGAENENMLLLDNTIVNKTVPLILCTEESVAGAHGATIGRPAEDVIFYMMSRGISKTKALQILERASLEAAANQIEDSGARDYVLGIIAKKYTDD
ncbi:MAG: SufD family Fe-S cluster assembly protein [Lachnospiraceae bacterium]|nr:SufD family Fe-S cluster assembly protein [Lachnospiraceae bacterium]